MFVRTYRPPLRRYGMGRGENTGGDAPWTEPTPLEGTMPVGPVMSPKFDQFGNKAGPQIVIARDWGPSSPNAKAYWGARSKDPDFYKQNKFDEFGNTAPHFQLGTYAGSGLTPGPSFGPAAFGPTILPTNWVNYPGVGNVPMALPANAGPTADPTQNVIHPHLQYKGRGPKMHVCKYCKGKGMVGYWPGRGMNGKMASLQPTSAADYISAGQTATSPSTDKEIAAISPQESIFNPKQLGALSVKPSQKHKLLPSQVKAIFAAQRAKA